MVFCNVYKQVVTTKEDKVTILILIDGFLQYTKQFEKKVQDAVSQSLF